MSITDRVGSFELTGNYQAVIGDLVSDPNYDPDVTPLAASVTFTANVSGPIRGRNFDPPTAFVIAPVEAMIDPADGLLKLRPDPDPQVLSVLSDVADASVLLRSIDPLVLCRMTADHAADLAHCWMDSSSVRRDADDAVKACLESIRADVDSRAVAPYAPVRLLCDSPLHELDRPLQWTARFSSVRYWRNGSASIDPFTFNAPSEPVVLDLVSVMRAPGQTANGITAGPKGDAATIAVGSVVTGVPGSQASVSNSGDENDAVFDFVIPRGDKGDKGDQGIPGATNTAPDTHAAPVKASPVDADELPLVDSAASWGLKKLTWANLKAAFAAYYNTLTATLTNKTLTNPKINQIVSTDGSWCISFNNNAPNGTYAELKNDQNVTQFIARSSVDADVDLSLFSKGAGTVKANGVPVVTTTGSQTLTGKTISGANNTLTAIPVGALTTTGTPSASTYLRGDGTWAAVAGGVTSVAGRTGVVTLTTADLTDATTVGKAVATAADAAAARTAIGAGTSNLAIGTTGSTAKAGNYTPTSGEVTTALGFTPQNTATAVSGSQAGVGAALTLWTGTQAQYDAIGSKSASTVYVVTA